MNQLKYPCDVSNCQKQALYKCPRCKARYCSTDCYNKHSETCVLEFQNSNLQALRGLKVSEEQRKHFNSILRRVKEEQDGSDTPIINEGPSEGNFDDDGHDQQTYAEYLTGEEEKDGDKDGDAAVLLTNLMEQLNDSGKDALFSVLQKSMAMEEDNKEGEMKQDDNQHKRTKKISKRHRTKQKSKQRPNVQVDQHHENEDLNELESLLEDIELTDMTYEEMLNRLPESCRKDFESRLREGQIQDLITVWKPWWTNHNSTNNSKRKSSNDDTDNEGEDKLSEPPCLPTSTDLTISVEHARRLASPNLIFHVIDVIGAYCLTIRLMNGDWHSDIINAASTLWKTSAVLADDARHENIDQVCHSLIKRVGKKLGPSVIQDVADMFSGSSCSVCRALFDAVNIALQAAMDIKEKKRKKAIQNGVRKLMFFTAWSLAERNDNYRNNARQILTFIDILTGKSEELIQAKESITLLEHRENENMLWLS